MSADVQRSWLITSQAGNHWILSTIYCFSKISDALPIQEPATTVKKLIKEFGVSVGLHWSQWCNFEDATLQMQCHVCASKTQTVVQAQMWELLSVPLENNLASSYLVGNLVLTVMVKCWNFITGILQILYQSVVCSVNHIKPWKSFICLFPFTQMFMYKSSSRSSTEWISSAELCTPSCAYLQAGIASLCGLKELYLSHFITMAHVAAEPYVLSSPGMGFPQVQGWLLPAKDLGRLGWWIVWAGALSWQDSAGMSTFTEFPFPSGNLGMDSWRPMQTEACGY